ncbi:MAG: hypothetical protein K2J46_08695 [Muribaculaceae bacterium]|nr:hypothetical protein [Muribaculaceae bacterium]
MDQLNIKIAKIVDENPQSILIRESANLLRRTPIQARMTPLAIRFN